MCELFLALRALDHVAIPVSSPDAPVLLVERLDLEQLYREHARYIAAVAARLLGRRDEVDDLVQDVFIAAQRGLRSIHTPDAVRGWLTTIAVRQARRRLRRRRLITFLGLDALGSRDVSRTLGPETSAILGQVYARLDRLPANQRLAWCLRYLEDEPLARVAALCGRSLATVKRWIVAANAALAGLDMELDDA